MAWQKDEEANDPLVARALSRLRENLSRRWSVEELAAELSTSRAVLARRFVETLRVPPMTALRQLRMDRVSELLESTDWGLTRIADAVGYDCEFSLSRAFYRQRGVRPGEYRRLRGSGTPVACAA